MHFPTSQSLIMMESTLKSCFDHKNHLRFFLLVFVFIFSPVLQTASSQSSVQPTPTVGVNSISFDSTNKKYKFFLNNSEVYEYSIISDGSFRAVTAFDYNANMFMPSNGGIVATLGGLDNMSSLNGNVSYKLLSHQFLTFDTVLVSWAMIVNNDTCNYSYKFNITGRTMVIKVETDSARVN